MFEVLVHLGDLPADLVLQLVHLLVLHLVHLHVHHLLKNPITSLTTSKNNIIITDNSFDPRFYSLSLSLYMLVSTLVTYSSTMSNSSSTTYLSATIPTTSTTSPTSLLLTLSSAQPPATSSNCTFYTLKMLLMTLLASILVTLSASMGTSNSFCGMSWTLWPMSGVYQC